MIIKLLGGLLSMIGELVIIGGLLTAGSAIYNKAKGKAISKHVANDAMRFAESAGANIVAAGSDIYNGIKNAINNKKKDKESSDVEDVNFTKEDKE